MIDRILELIQNYCEVDSITPETNLLQNLPLSSLDFMNLVMDLEDEFGVTVPDSALDQIQTVGGILQYLDYPWYPKLKADNIRHMMKKQAALLPDAYALHDWERDGDRISLTYGQLYEQILQLGTWMYQHQIKEKRIVLFCENSWEWVLLFLAAVCGRNVVVLFDPQLPPEQIRSALSDHDVDTIAYSKKFRDLVLSELAAENILDLEDMQSMIAEGSQLMKQGMRDYVQEHISPEQEMAVCCTSGTTGGLKGAVLTHGGAVWNACHVMSNLKICGKILGFIPYFHVYGMMDCLLYSFASGCEICVSHTPRTMFRTLDLYRPVWIYVVPMMAESIRRKVEGKETVQNLLGEQIRGIIVGGAAMAEETKEFFRKQGITAICGYGMTEAYAVIAVDRNETDKLGSVGRVLEGLKVRIDEKTGEILVESQRAMKEYYRKPSETAEVLQNGWLHTGDIGYLDERQCLTITGRMKNLIILSNGENVPPEILEQKLMVCQAVAECRVTGRQDVIVAEIYPNETYLAEHEIAESAWEEYFYGYVNQCNEELPSFQRIRKIELRREAFPKTGSGKIIR